MISLPKKTAREVIYTIAQFLGNAFFSLKGHLFGPQDQFNTDVGRTLLAGDLATKWKKRPLSDESRPDIDVTDL